MGQISYGTITITDTNDIERIYPVYCRGGELTAPALLPLTNWKENISEITTTGDYIWQRIVTKKSGISVTQNDYGDAVRLTGDEGDAALNIDTIEVQYGSSANWNTSPNNWSSDVPAYDSTKPCYWTRSRLKYEDNTYSSDWIVSKDQGLTDAITQAAAANSIAQSANENAQGALSQVTEIGVIAEGLQTKLKYMWRNLNADTQAYPTGTYAASGIDGVELIESNSSTYGFNSLLRHTQLLFRYNAINLTTIGIDGIKLYRPTVSNNIITNSTLGVELTSEALKFYSSNDDSNAIASFGETITIGKNASGNSRSELSSSGMQIYRNDGGTDTQIANLGYGIGNTTADEMGNAPYYTFGTRKTTATPYSSSNTYAYGDLCVYNDKVYVCIIDIETPEAWTSSHWKLSIGNYSVAEGSETLAFGAYSHTEGYNTIAGHRGCHAEGIETLAWTPAAHAEGWKTQAVGQYTHAQNVGTIATSNGQTAIGRYNIEDTHDNMAFIIGNGNSSTRKNAFAVSWRGQVYVFGDFINLPTGGQYRIGQNPLLTIDTKSVASTTIYAGDYDTITVSISKDGYTPIGIVGYRIQNASSGGANASYINVYRAEISGTNALLGVRNIRTGSNDAVIQTDVNILYMAT